MSSLPNTSLTLSAETIYTLMQVCMESDDSQWILLTYNLICFTIHLPLCVFVITVVCRQWHSGRANMSHTDVITFNTSIVELLSLLGSTLCFVALCTRSRGVWLSGMFLWSLKLSGFIWFHVLTCLEHYLAVIHPVKYLRLRKSSFISQRNLMIAGAWLLSMTGAISMNYLAVKSHMVIWFLIFTSSLIIILFFDCSLFCRLTHSGPKEEFGSRQGLNPMKLRALVTITAILAVLVLKLSHNVIGKIISLQDLNSSDMCPLLMSVVWFSLPVDLVLPLLFLQRSWRVLCCKSKADPDRVCATS